MNKENIETILEFILIACMIVAVMFGALMYSDGNKYDDPFKMINGMAIMLLMCMIMLDWRVSIIVRQKNKEIEELKTDLVLLENRCDWMEDDICKEYEKDWKNEP